MQSLVQYRKKQLQNELYKITVKEALNRHFDILRMEMINAIKLPSILSEGNFVAKSAYQKACKEDFEDNKSIIEFIIQSYKDNLYKHILAETASTKVKTVDDLKNELDIEIKSLVNNLRDDIEKVLAASRPLTGDEEEEEGKKAATGLTSPLTGSLSPSKSTSTSSGGLSPSSSTSTSSGGLSPSSSTSTSSGAPSSSSSTSTSSGGLSPSSSTSTSSGAPSSGSSSGAPSASSSSGAPSASAHIGASHSPGSTFTTSTSSHGGHYAAPSSTGTSHGTSYGTTRPPITRGGVTYTPSPYGYLKPHDKWWKGVKRAIYDPIAGWVSKKTRNFRRRWHDDPMREHSMFLETVFLESFLRIEPIIADFEKNITDLIKNRVEKIVAAVGGKIQSTTTSGTSNKTIPIDKDDPADLAANPTGYKSSDPVEELEDKDPEILEKTSVPSVKRASEKLGIKITSGINNIKPENVVNLDGTALSPSNDWSEIASNIREKVFEIIKKIDPEVESNYKKTKKEKKQAEFPGKRVHGTFTLADRNAIINSWANHKYKSGGGGGGRGLRNFLIALDAKFKEIEKGNLTPNIDNAGSPIEPQTMSGGPNLTQSKSDVLPVNPRGEANILGNDQIQQEIEKNAKDLFNGDLFASKIYYYFINGGYNPPLDEIPELIKGMKKKLENQGKKPNENDIIDEINTILSLDIPRSIDLSPTSQGENVGSEKKKIGRSRKLNPKVAENLANAENPPVDGDLANTENPANAENPPVDGDLANTENPANTETPADKTPSSSSLEEDNGVQDLLNRIKNIYNETEIDSSNFDLFKKYIDSLPDKLKRKEELDRELKRAIEFSDKIDILKQDNQDDAIKTEKENFIKYIPRLNNSTSNISNASSAVLENMKTAHKDLIEKFENVLNFLPKENIEKKLNDALSVFVKHKNNPKFAELFNTYLNNIKKTEVKKFISGTNSNEKNNLESYLKETKGNENFDKLLDEFVNNNITIQESEKKEDWTSNLPAKWQKKLENIIQPEINEKLEQIKAGKEILKSDEEYKEILSDMEDNDIDKLFDNLNTNKNFKAINDLYQKINSGKKSDEKTKPVSVDKNFVRKELIENFKDNENAKEAGTNYIRKILKTNYPDKESYKKNEKNSAKEEFNTLLIQIFDEYLKNTEIPDMEKENQEFQKFVKKAISHAITKIENATENIGEIKNMEESFYEKLRNFKQLLKS